LRDEGNYEKEQRVVRTVEMIANQLLDCTCPSSSVDLSKRKIGMNQVEMSMVFWAFAILFPRHIPAGWELPPRVGLMEGTRMGNTRLDDDLDDETIIFETLQDSKDVNVARETNQPRSIVDQLFDAMATRMVEPVSPKQGDSTLLQKCEWKELSTIAWSFAYRGYCQGPSAQMLILNLVVLAISRIENNINERNKMLPRDAAVIAWALGTMQSDCHILSDPLEKFVNTVGEYVIDKLLERPLMNWKSADCVQMAIALGHGRLDQKDLLREIYREALISLKETLEQAKEGEHGQVNKPFLDFEIVVLLWVQARLYLTADLGDIFDEFAEIVPQMILYRMHLLHDNGGDKSLHFIQQALNRLRLGSQEQANLVWSLTVLEKYHSNYAVELLGKIFSAYSASCKDGNLIPLEHAHQLWQSIVILQHECPQAVKHVDSATMKFLQSTWNREKARKKSSSARHRALSQTLNFMGVKHNLGMEYGLQLAVPHDFYAEKHRPGHFLQFAATEDATGGANGNNNDGDVADVEDFLN
jgi:hypothetical protein